MAKSNYERVKEWRAANPDKVAAQHKRYATKHPDKMAEKKARYRAANIDEIREADRVAKARSRKIDPEGQWRRMEAFKQRRHAERVALAGRDKPDVCEICSEAGKIVFDHDHATDGFRGWICDRCNKTLGHVKDDPELLYKLAEYLERINVQVVLKAA